MAKRVKSGRSGRGGDSRELDVFTVERCTRWLASDEMADLRESIRRPLVPAIRVNSLKIDPAEAARLWSDWYGWNMQPVSFCPDGWQVSGGMEDISRTLEHKMSLYYIQDAASMLPAGLFDFAPGARPLVLDMAASPGGKTTHLIDRLQDSGLVIANDSAPGRMAPLRVNLQGWGATNTAITNSPGERFGAWLPEAFDFVLLDAPCSGAGLRTAERHKGRRMSHMRREAFHELQVSLLKSAFQALKPGGQLVYATCSLDPIEDEAVVDALLRAYPGAATVESPLGVLPTPAPGMTSDGETVFDERVARSVRLWPHLYDTAGFFVALLRKLAPVPAERMTAPRRPLTDAGFDLLRSDEVRRISDDLQQMYGFDLASVLQARKLVMWRRGDSLHAIPERYLADLDDFPAVAIGMMIGQDAPDGLTPSHELVSRFWPLFSTQRAQVTDEQAAVWLAGRDLRGSFAHHGTRGSTVLLEDERHRFLGRGKALADRVRNLLPRYAVY